LEKENREREEERIRIENEQRQNEIKRQAAIETEILKFLNIVKRCSIMKILLK